MSDPRVDQLEQLMEIITKKLEDLSNKMESRESLPIGEASTSRNRGNRMNGSGSNSLTPKIAKLDFPCYNGGEDPTSWICRVEQFFELQQIPEEDKLPLAAYHLEGDAQLWYQLFKDSNEGVTWLNLKQALNARYGPTLFEHHFGDLTKLKQVHSVRDYQTHFERLLSRVGRLSTEHQIRCFISGLKDHIRVDVQVAHPTTLSDAIGLARLFEARNGVARMQSTGKEWKPVSLELVPPLPSQSLTRSKGPVVKRLTPAELQERRNRGLCFNCDERFTPGHRCKKLFLLEGIYPEEVTVEEAHLVLSKEESEPVISLHAMMGSMTPQTMRV